ncbi:hypothetical protein CAEBREN_12628 [Caenorhabditis brenneri]|uniref:C-type lectin domain-containing protein n=1 Tax=Caenorhabditis brenneri TaxID=135651 RepID=G0PAT4_CAEBE|nr:hypothetical protein CAEBREN_12628 [Caenorhabditis brenneri]
MKCLLLFLCFFCLITVITAIFESEGGKRNQYSSSSSDEDSNYERRKKKKHHHHGRPPGNGNGGEGNGNGGGGKACPSDWMTFDRPQGRWCVKLFVGTMMNLAAETRCREMNATLTGLQTDAERLKLAEAGRTIMLQNNYGDASIWLGAHRKGSCPSAQMCYPKETFFWLDNHTTGNEGFGWATGQPDAGTRGAWGVQSCAHQFIFSSGTTNPRWPGIIHGQLDDQYCQEGVVDPNIKMYACGRKPF